MRKHKANTIQVIAAAVLMSVIYGFSCSAATATGPGADPEYTADSMPKVYYKMFDVGYWIDDKDYSQRLMTSKEIEDFNTACHEVPDTVMQYITELPDTFNGIKMRDSLAGFADPKTHYINGTEVPASFYENLRKRIRSAKVSEAMPLRYGLCVNRTEMKEYPYDELISDSQDDPEWDDFVSCPLTVGEPVAVYFTTGDGKWTLVKNEVCSGWVKSEDIALCKDKEEFLKTAYPKDFLIVTGSSIRTEKSSLTDSGSEKDLEMGTKLGLCTDDAQMVNNRMSWYNYVVYLPTRQADGSLKLEKALIPVGRDVNIGYLKFTKGRLLEQAFKCLGNRYGWGGMMGSQDCSSFVRQLYSCFGFDLPRNTTRQGKMPCRKVDMSSMTVSEKRKLLDSIPKGSILMFPGHEMLWLGEDNGEYYVINDVSSLALDQEDGSLLKYRVRDVIINSLEATKRANGKTWMDSLTLAIVPFEKDE